MQPSTQPIPTSPVAEQLLDALPAAAMLVAPDNHQIIHYNKATRNLIGTTITELSNNTCHSFLSQKDTPCTECAERHAANTSIPEFRSTTVQLADGSDCFLKYQCALWEGHHIITLFDVNQEFKLLHTLDMTRQEQQARLARQDRRQDEVLATLGHLEQMIDHIPEAVLSVDESFFILKQNKATEAFPTNIRAQRCFNLVGRTTPCDDCPAIEGFGTVTEHIKNHTVDGLYITETITKSPKDDGGLLIFRDTTRQIKLVQQIKGQQDNITRQNDILSGLVRFGTYVQQENSLSSVLEFFLQLFLPVINADNAVIIVNDIRPGNILCHVEQGVTEQELSSLMRVYLSRDMQTNLIDVIPDQAMPWKNNRQIPLLGTDGRRVGLLVTEDVDSEHDENIQLFAEPLGACIHNRLLTLTLEEKANTDPLTGTYNRGYFHRALEMEQDKLKKLNINHAVVAADINRLKQANDLHGHEVGDQLILAASNLLKQAIRTGDVVARTGGDEFLTLLTNTGSKGAAAFIDRLNNKLSEGIFVTINGNQKFPVEISLGYAGTDEYAPEMIIKEADRRMYEAKKAYYRQHPERRR